MEHITLHTATTDNWHYSIYSTTAKKVCIPSSRNNWWLATVAFAKKLLASKVLLRGVQRDGKSLDTHIINWNCECLWHCYAHVEIWELYGRFGNRWRVGGCWPSRIPLVYSPSFVCEALGVRLESYPGSLLALWSSRVSES